MPITRAGLVGPRGVSTEMLWSRLLPSTTVPSATATGNESDEASSKRAPAAIAGRMQHLPKKGTGAFPSRFDPRPRDRARVSGRYHPAGLESDAGRGRNCQDSQLAPTF